MPNLAIIWENNNLEGRSVELEKFYFSHKSFAIESDRNCVSKTSFLKILSKAVGFQYPDLCGTKTGGRRS